VPAAPYPGWNLRVPATGAAQERVSFAGRTSRSPGHGRSANGPDTKRGCTAGPAFKWTSRAPLRVQPIDARVIRSGAP